MSEMETTLTDLHKKLLFDMSEVEQNGLGEKLAREFKTCKVRAEAVGLVLEMTDPLKPLGEQPTHVGAATGLPSKPAYLGSAASFLRRKPERSQLERRLLSKKKNKPRPLETLIRAPMQEATRECPPGHATRVP